MENSSSSHDYGCSTIQEIPRTLENLKGGDNYKTLHTKMWTQYSQNQYSNKAVCVLFCRLLCTKEPPLTLTMSLTKTIKSSHPIFFKHWLLNYHPKSPKCFLLFRFSKQTLYSPLLYHMHATCRLWIIFLATIMLIISG